MRKAALLLLLTLTVALTAAADDRHQSFISYDEGGTVVKTADREVEAQRNLPIYPGDEVVTARRGRAEVMLSDGNIIGIDRATSLRFRSILDSYEGDSNETVAELRYGKVAIHRTDIGREHVRLDTDNASYVAPNEAVYSVETDQRGRDRITVFDGSVEVRTPQRSTRLRRGESASVDDEGVYDLVGDQRASADDFERWFLKRAERYGTYDNRYVDRRIGYWADDLDTHGRWVMVTGIGWSWRPYVSVGWRPYYNGYWYSRHGCLTWVSYDPWGWAPYHYGRWAYDPGFGWVWVPGYSYSPAWVYWMYGPSYVGWAPAGWWDCHRPYYDWAYRPYRRHDFGFGFNGRIRVADVDLRPWTFMDSNTIFTSRVDRAALTTDVIKQRLGRTDRGNDGWATISGAPARFTREEIRDPAAAIKRRGLGGDPSGATGVNTDLTPFIRRDPNLGATVRDRIVRSRPSDSTTPSGPTRVSGGGGVAPITGGGVAPIGRGGLAPVGGGSVAPITGGGDPRSVDRGGNDAGTSTGRNRDTSGAIRRDRPDDTRDAVDRGSSTSTDRNSSSGSGSTSTWRDRVNRGGGSDRSTDTPSTTAPAPTVVPRDDSWRNNRSGRDNDSSDSGSTSRGSNDVPSRVIDRIGGARVVPRHDDGDNDNDSSSSRSRDTGSVDRGSRSSGGSRDSGSVERRRDSGDNDSGSSRRGGAGGYVQRGGSSNSGSSGSGSSAGSSRSSGGNNGGGNSDSGSSSRGSSGGNRESGGKIKRDH